MTDQPVACEAFEADIFDGTKKCLTCGFTAEEHPHEMALRKAWPSIVFLSDQLDVAEKEGIRLDIHVDIPAHVVLDLGNHHRAFDVFIEDALSLVLEEAANPDQPHQSELIFEALRLIAQSLIVHIHTSSTPAKEA
jgi:hypothetical protein